MSRKIMIFLPYQHNCTVDITQSIQAKVYSVSCQVKANYLFKFLVSVLVKNIIKVEFFF